VGHNQSREHRMGVVEVGEAGDKGAAQVLAVELLASVRGAV
jgi:hypothetical protein